MPDMAIRNRQSNKRWLTTQMAFHGFSAEGVDLLQLNRLQNSKEFYDAHKDEIKRLSIRPFHELIAEMTPEMVKIDPQFVTVPSRMVSRVRRDTRYTRINALPGEHVAVLPQSTTGTRIRSRILFLNCIPNTGPSAAGARGAEAKWKRCAK